MDQLKIAGNSIFASGFGHLQIVYGDGTSDLEIEVQAPTDVVNPFSGSWDVVPIRDHSSNTPFFGNSFFYDIAVVPLVAGQTALGG